MNEEKVKNLFRYEHLPPHLQLVSKPFHDMALTILKETMATPEQTLALRKLWEAKNLIVWDAS